MTPDFARAVDPCFLLVIDLVDRLEKGDGLTFDEVRRKIDSVLTSTDQLLASRGDLAKITIYGLVCWIDELMINTLWAGRPQWINQTLEFKRYQKTEAYTKFYQSALYAMQSGQFRDALEVYYLCVVLGFQGMYRVAEGATSPPDPATLGFEPGFPKNVEAWLKWVSQALVLRSDRPPLQSGEPGEIGFRPLNGQQRLMGAAMICMILAALLTIVVPFLFILPNL